jgi:hypothetical protein
MQLAEDEGGVASGTFHAVVTDIREERRVGGVQRWQMSLDATEFSPERASGVLQVEARSGARMEIAVLSVVEADGDLWHVVEKPLGVGTAVTGRVG